MLNLVKETGFACRNDAGGENLCGLCQQARVGRLAGKIGLRIGMSRGLVGFRDLLLMKFWASSLHGHATQRPCRHKPCASRATTPQRMPECV